MYNSLASLPYIPYRIMEYLAASDDPKADILWKMLAYNDYEALDKPSLTISQRLELLWRTGKQDDCSVFLTNLIEDAIAESKTIIKIYDYYIHAKELYYSTVVYCFDCLYGGQMSLVKYNGVPVSRGDLFINCILIFLDDLSRYNAARSVVGNSKTFTGVQLYIGVNVGDEGVEQGCET